MPREDHRKGCMNEAEFTGGLEALSRAETVAVAGGKQREA